MKPTNITLSDTYEANGYTVEFDINGKCYPGEPMVMYTPNGDGYPGSPPDFEILSINITAVYDEEGALTDTYPEDEIMDLLLDWCDDHLLDLADEAFELASEDYRD